MAHISSKVKFAVIGFGYIGMRHANTILSNESCELVALIDVKQQDPLAIEKYDVPFFFSLDAFFDSEIQADVITIASPNGLHAEHAMKCLNRGKHVVVEKPMALNKSDAEKMISTALSVNRQIFVVMQNRYAPPVTWIKGLLEKEQLGKIYLVQVNCFWNRDERYYKAGGWHGKQDMDGGPLFTQFSHFIDIIYWLFGDIINIQGRFKDYNHQTLTEFEDSGFVSFDFINGGMGTLNYSTAVWNQNLESSMTIIAANGSIKIGGQYMDKVEICNVKGYEMPENDHGASKGSVANHQYVIRNVVDVLNGRASIATNALEGLKVVDIIERIYNCKIHIYNQ
ncbi:Gfo/Idh/MocA family protein [Pedobacter heparinus]|uniref:Oxidoreductase domain protein n=1 Tax=Pedobacter heparinus (strain ATCC 13125 / DSM 2366 / CIP 104194 / JCM 7457 / NBRC 12017 / NCIMB 9290 / NRRL B-14731 / HIM 762-3) TaxID=485917 RepID=C6Y0L4_PEDHD|nr:Gfo/Idh/MocA family oxidoreductase [Pedobacter heparinus]ACU02775.1 oxidoreductase domain protein [Pedobacter heparinus DSM 2366]